MLTRKICTLLLGIYLWIPNGVYATPEDKIKLYIQANYPQEFKLSTIQLQQLTWILDHKRRSYDMDMYVAKNSMHIEVVRALNRLYCLRLLKSGTKHDYDKFIAAQVSVGVTNPLSFNSFKKLSKHIQLLLPLDYTLLETATILSAVSLSVEATRLAQQIIGLHKNTNNNLEFISASVRANPNIYPITKQLVSENPTAIKLLYIVFPPQTNFRHMLYTEGGVGMFKYLRAMITHKYMNKEELDLWYAYWIINISGFRAHVMHDGSVYLTEPVYQVMTKLKSLLDIMLESPNYNPLIPYLEYRAELLGLHNLAYQDRLLVAHLGALMRLYTFEDGKQLIAGFDQLSKQQKYILADYFNSSLKNYDCLGTTYVPALFANMLVLLDGDIKQAIKIITPIYIRAIQINPRVSLSFNTLSSVANLKKIIHMDTAELVKLVRVAADGEVQF